MKNLFSLIIFILFISSCTEEPIQKYPTKIVNFEPEKAAELAKKIREDAAVEVADGLELSLWASDSLVHDPIAISVDPQGKIYYTSATRQTNSEFDVRGHRNWITASISFQSVEDRRAFLKKTFEADNEESTKFLKDLNEDGIRDWKDLAVEKEQVWIVSDQSKDGFADQSKLYIEDFGDEITDVANGVEYAFGNVYISVGPDLWKTTDVTGDDIADKTESLSHGFAVHIGFSGHGMSGVTMGPDGRVWWGIGDIGMNVVDKSGKHWKYPNRGVVVRCEPDGSNFEVFAMGVRNTHEFVFDKFGNLISVDNDGDHSGERERLVYLIDGSDTGWRINWQFGKYTDPDNNKYKVWMDEKMHIPRWEGQPAYILPPIQNYVNGPTGMVYNPGTALSPDWYDHFFVAEFRGTPSASPIHAFTLEPDGAGFALDTTQIVVSGLLPTGLDFGPEGALYFGDWINGWGTKDEGRIWKLDVDDPRNAEIRKSTKTLIEEDFSNKKLEELGDLLGHQDMRVRTKAQFELVNRKDKGNEILLQAALNADVLLSRIHGIWGINQLSRKDIKYAKAFDSLIKESDSEVVAQTCKAIGDVRYDGVNEFLIQHTRNPSIRVQFFAIEALGRIGSKDAIPSILNTLEENDSKDQWLQMAGMIALGRIGKPEPLIALKNHPSKALRLAAVVALRRMEHKGIAEFLNDQDENVAAEAARGINDDFSIESALPALADILNKKGLTSEPLLRRAINANLRVGENENATTLLMYANQTSAPEAMRAEAVAALSTWSKPSVFDRVDGRHRGTEERDIKAIKEGIGKDVNKLLSSKSENILIATCKLVSKFQLKDKAASLLGFLKNNKSEKVREASLAALQSLKAEELEEALDLALKDRSSIVRSKGLELLPESNISEKAAVQLFEKIIQSGSIKEQQTALSALGKLNGDNVNKLLQKLLTQLQSGKIKPEIRLDVIDVASISENESVKQALETYQASKSKDDPLAEFRETLAGGNKNSGRNIFYDHEGAQCTRCHAIFEYGGNAGPGLEGVGSRLSEEQLLAALVTPSAEYALGYEVVSIELNSGETIAGTIIEKEDDFIKIKLGKEDIKTIYNSDIKASQSLPSSMIPVGSVLKKKEIRDLVTFLASLKQEG